MQTIHIKLEQIDTRAANLIKQELHNLGGEAAISQESYAFTARSTDILLSGSIRCIKLLSKKIADGQHGLNEIAKEIDKCLSEHHGVMKIGNKVFDFKHRTYISGVINYHKFLETSHSEAKILKKVEDMIHAGASFINIYQENILNKNDRESEKKELDHIIKIIHQVKTKFPESILSIDTSQLNIAKLCVEAGVDIISKTAPLKYNEDLIRFIAENHIPVVMMAGNGYYENSKPIVSISDLIKDIQANVIFAISRGVDRDKIIIDPGVGFGRSDKDNFLILRQLSTIKHLNFPILVGMSRRSFLGDALKGKMNNRHLSTIATNTIAIINGANIIKVHTVEQMATMVNIIDSLEKFEDHSI
jgi:dihydropteroate synthase